ncbi:hypothetical protein ACZ90_07975 [Streptomyces albus subsp. albus]|nr:hypothetical protein ACZ90_07975 [Streptomyces albus subsp. albus]
MNHTTSPHRAGFACFVGRPNAGKSTLTNALVGQKVAITSNRPQTTRHTVRGIVHRDDAQLILVDTPGLHKPRTLLGERLNDVVRTTWAEVDVIGFCLPADQKLGPGDKYIVKELAGIRKTPKIAIITKTDLVDSKTLAEQLLAVSALAEELGFEWAEIVPVYVYIERPSQKGIIIGPKGQRLKDVGTKSRKHIEALLGTPVFLDLHVKVAKDWQRDPKQLRKLGF